jgi:hypothetical protein
MDRDNSSMVGRILEMAKTFAPPTLQAPTLIVSPPLVPCLPSPRWVPSFTTGTPKPLLVIDSIDGDNTLSGRSPDPSARGVGPDTF